VRFIKGIANFVRIFARFYSRRRYFPQLFTFERSVVHETTLRFLRSVKTLFLTSRLWIKHTRVWKWTRARLNPRSV